MLFSKMHGLSNDFMIVDCIRQKNILFSTELIKKLANRHTGIGFDQLLIVETPINKDYDFNYRIFNADGHEVEQCGNGARCFAIFVKLKGLTTKDIIKVSTKKGLITLNIIKDNLVCVNMGQPDFYPYSIPFKSASNTVKDFYSLKIENKSILCGLVSLGNPHCIILVNKIKNYKVHKIGSLIENNKKFLKKTNVGFVEKINSNEIKLRVYERGVGETQACGSGACAAVAIGVKRGFLKGKVSVHLLGGTLDIVWKGPGYPIFMTGTAVHIYDGDIKNF